MGAYAARGVGYPSGVVRPSPRPEKPELTTSAPERSPRPTNTPDQATRQTALAIAQRLDEKQAKDIVVLDVSGPLVIADYFVIATVQSTRQGQALAKELDLESKATRGRRRRNTGGLETEESNWVLLDFDDVVVHLFLPEARAYYALEELWADVPRVPFTPAPPTTKPRVEVRQPTVEGLGAFLPPAPPDGEDAPPTGPR
ncbi:MAG: ribosome silencing factor [Planctomycetes bacterium]|nr:ribosome silencing factor [Planctomycetota bacterium]